MSHCNTRAHPDHSPELPRINRVGGQLEGVKKMITEGRYCPEILAQLRAIRAALHAIEANILERHLDGCVQDALSGNDASQKLAELKELYKRFGD